MTYNDIKSHKKRGFTFSIEAIFFEKPQVARSNWPSHPDFLGLTCVNHKSWIVNSLVESVCVSFLSSSSEESGSTTRLVASVFRSSHRRCSVKKGVLKNFTKFIGRHLCWCLFLVKFQDWGRLLLRLLNCCILTFLFMWNTKGAVTWWSYFSWISFLSSFSTSKRTLLNTERRKILLESF